MQGNMYFLTVRDNFSRFCWIYLMRQKSKTTMLIKSFISFVQNQFQTFVKIMRSDNGPEFTLKFFYLTQGVIHKTSCMDIP